MLIIEPSLQLPSKIESRLKLHINFSHRSPNTNICKQIFLLKVICQVLTSQARGLKVSILSDNSDTTNLAIQLKILVSISTTWVNIL
jgi:hypothetical protein